MFCVAAATETFAGIEEPADGKSSATLNPPPAGSRTTAAAAPGAAIGTTTVACDANGDWDGIGTGVEVETAEGFALGAWGTTATLLLPPAHPAVKAAPRTIAPAKETRMTRS